MGRFDIVIFKAKITVHYLKILITVVKTIFERIWLALFAHSSFWRLNQYLLNLTQKSLGINNYKSEKISGEIFWINYVLKNYQPDVIFDIGAHKGDYTKLFRDAGFKGTIYLFEPHPKTYSVLTHQIRATEFDKIFNLGFSETRGNTLIFDYSGESLESGSPHASLFSQVITDLHGSSNVTEVKVQLRTLDDFTEEHKIERISLLKIDTEGNEFPILKGSRRLLEEGRIDLIQFEFGEMNVVSRYFFKDFFDLLNSNYCIYRLLPSGLLPITKYNARHHEIFIYQNIVCVHRKLK